MAALPADQDVAELSSREVLLSVTVQKCTLLGRPARLQQVLDQVREIEAGAAGMLLALTVTLTVLE